MAADSKKSSLKIRDEFPAPSREEWREAVTQDLKGADFDKRLVWQTIEGIPVQPLYSAEDAVADPAAVPGRAPFVRGTRAPKASVPAWQVAQEIALASPAKANEVLRRWQSQEKSTIAVRLDEATRRGYGPDEEEAANLVGANGTVLCSISCLRKLLEEINFADVPVTLRAGAGAMGALAMLLALGRERGVKPRTLTGSMDYDPVSYLAMQGILRAPLEFHYRCAADMVSYCAEHWPGLRPLTAHSAHWQNAGASAAEELACTLATGVEYLRELATREVPLERAALGMTFSFAVTPMLFPEIAKLRAARGLWAKIVAAFGVENADAQRMFLHVHGSQWAKSRYDVHNNLVRSSIEAFAGAAAGADAMTVEPFDSTLGAPSEFALRLARNQQFLLREESYLGRVADPAGGAWYIESLTDSLAREAWKIFQEIEAEGGIVAALKSHSIQKRLAKTAGAREKQITGRRAPIVGVSNYPNLKEGARRDGNGVDDEFRRKERESVEHLKSVRDSAKLEPLLGELTDRAKTRRGHCLEVAIDAAREGATVGEIFRALLTGIPGDGEHCEPLPVRRAADPFERLRDRAFALAAQSGRRPKVLLVPIGPATMRRARVDFSTGFFGAGGFDVEEPNAFSTAEEAAAALANSDADVAVVCSDDASYPEVVPAILDKLKGSENAPPLHIAGWPADHVDALKAKGVAGFIHVRSNVVEELDRVLAMVEERP